MAECLKVSTQVQTDCINVIYKRHQNTYKPVHCKPVTAVHTNHTHKKNMKKINPTRLYYYGTFLIVFHY